MRSTDSRTLRWTVHLTAQEFALLEAVRSQWRGQSRAQLLIDLVEWVITDDSWELAANRPVIEAWQGVQEELKWTDDHTARGGRQPRINLHPAANGRR